jgi:hypothetical protein
VDTPKIESKLVFIETFKNDLVYLKNQVPQLLRVADKILMADDFSTDGTEEWIRSLNEPKIEYYKNKWEGAAEQFDFLLQKAPKDNTWIFNITAIELPTESFFRDIRNVLIDCRERDVDRVWSTVYHLRGEREICQELGGEIRLFLNSEHHNIHFIGEKHECIDGKFDGHCIQQPNEGFAFVRFRQADPKKIEEWKTLYVELGLYSLFNINRRLSYPTIMLPYFINYEINKELREYLKW